MLLRYSHANSEDAGQISDGIITTRTRQPELSSRSYAVISTQIVSSTGATVDFEPPSDAVRTKGKILLDHRYEQEHIDVSFSE